MRTNVVIAVALLAFIALATIFHRAPLKPPAITTPGPPTMSSQRSREVDTLPREVDTLPREGVIAQTGNSAPDYAQRYREAEDVWDFAETLLSDARKGDGAAQFYLFKALSECEFQYDLFFTIKQGSVERYRTLDEGLQRAVTLASPFSLDDVRAIYSRCHRLGESKGTPFGDADQWLRAATDNAYPLAQIHIALDKAIGISGNIESANSKAARDEVHNLVWEAVRSKDPAVIASVGSIERLLHTNEPSSEQRNEWAWLLAACQRGYDCSRQSDWYRVHCGIETNCQPYESGVVDVIRRIEGAQYDEIDSRARHINEMLDQGRFDELRY